MSFRRSLAVLALTACMLGGTYAVASKSRPAPQGYLGVVIRDLNDQQVVALHLKDIHGAEIVQVDHDGPAGKAGLRSHDIILQVGGKIVSGADHLRQMLQSIPPGRIVSFLILREGQQQTVTAQLADRAEVEKQAWEQHMTVPEPSQDGSLFNSSLFSDSVPPAAPAPPTSHSSNTLISSTTLLSSAYTGAILETISPQLADFFGVTTGAGLLVRSVDPDSPAAQAGMRAGDVVVRINVTVIVGASDWSRLIFANRGRSVSLVVLRDKHEETLTIVPDAKKRSALELPPLVPSAAAKLPV